MMNPEELQMERYKQHIQNWEIEDREGGGVSKVLF